MEAPYIPGVERLDRSPYDPGEDRTYWRASVEGRDVHLWVTGTDSVRVPDDEDQWIRSEIERLVAEYDDIDTVYALSPIQLRPS